MEPPVGNRAIPLVSVGGVLLIVMVLTLTGNSGEDEGLSPVEEGRKLYTLICAACHHPDPTKDRVGENYGPPIAGSSRQLLELRVLSTSYPEGYIPKRDTSSMPTFPLKKAQLDALFAFLEDAAGDGVNGR